MLFTFRQPPTPLILIVSHGEREREKEKEYSRDVRTSHPILWIHSSSSSLWRHAAGGGSFLRSSSRVMMISTAKGNESKRSQPCGGAWLRWRFLPYYEWTRKRWDEQTNKRTNVPSKQASMQARKTYSMNTNNQQSINRSRKVATKMGRLGIRPSENCCRDVDDGTFGLY